RNRNFPQDFVSLGAADAVDVLQGNNNTLVGRQIDASDASQVSYLLAAARPWQTRKVPAAIYRFECHLRKATNVKGPRLPCLLRPGIAAHLRLDISGLLMDSERFRQPARVISPIVLSGPTTAWPARVA